MDRPQTGVETDCWVRKNKSGLGHTWYNSGPWDQHHSNNYLILKNFWIGIRVELFIDSSISDLEKYSNFHLDSLTILGQIVPGMKRPNKESRSLEICLRQYFNKQRTSDSNLGPYSYLWEQYSHLGPGITDKWIQNMITSDFGDVSEGYQHFTFRQRVFIWISICLLLLYKGL